MAKLNTSDYIVLVLAIGALAFTIFLIFEQKNCQTKYRQLAEKSELMIDAILTTKNNRIMDYQYKIDSLNELYLDIKFKNIKLKNKYKNHGTKKNWE